MSSFEAIRHSDEDGQEFWSARELMVVLDYHTWLKFKPVIKKAQES
jgi:DNA-damage-inducible protein D